MSNISKTDATPTMTSNTSPIGEAFASSIASSTYDAWRVFDKVNPTTTLSYWRTASVTPKGQFVGYEFNEKKKIGKYSIKSYVNANRNPRSWIFQGSNDRLSWIDLDVRSGILFGENEVKDFEIDNQSEFKSYRILIEENAGNTSYVEIAEISMYEIINLNKTLIKNNNIYKYHNGNNWVDIGSSVSEQSYIDFGMDDLSTVSQSAWNELTNVVELFHYTDDSAIIEVQYSVETNPFTLSDELGSSFSVIEYTDSPIQNYSEIQLETETYSVYDYISESPEVLVYSELDDDITVETKTEPFTIYDEFGNEVEVLHYTDDASVNQTNLVLEANWSPIDELDGDLEVVTWTNEENAFRKLEVDGELAPKLIYPTTINTIIGDVANIKVALQNSNGSERFVLTDNNSTWYVWNGSTFIVIPKEDISLRGMTLEELNNSDFSKWTRSKIAVGVFADSTTEITSISYDEAIRNKTSKVNDISLYVLNTTAKIDIQLTGSTVRGTLSDADSTKVQYRVVLNDSYYYPSNGNFTALTPSPVPIEFTLKSSDVKVGDWNKLKVEFKDYFGTTDYWEVEFIGRYSGVMFRTIDGQYYSSDIGEVLRYLDFGSIVSGQTTMIQTIVLKNEFGYGISNVDLSVNTNALPKGVNVEFSRNGINQWSPTLRIADSMAMDEEVRFDVRMRTVITATPTPNGKFDIFVMAKKSE